MTRQTKRLVVVTCLLLSFAGGCGAGKATKVADLEGKWEFGKGVYPLLSLKSDGTGVCAIPIAARGQGTGLLMIHVEVRRENGKFLFQFTNDGESFHFEVIPLDKQTLTLKRVDANDVKECTLKKS